jgi:hypothetical protein
MKRITVYRFYKSDTATIGCFCIGKQLFYTIEDPDKNNIKNTSCIPSGTYICELSKSNTNLAAKIDVAYSINDVPNRNKIRFAHIANTTKDVSGCFGIGLRVDLESEAVLDSIKAVKKFYKMLDNEIGLNPIELVVVE